MTAKRFEYKNHKVYDNLTGETHSSNMVSVNVLNELHDEKQSVIDWIDNKIEEIKPYNSELCRATLLKLKEFLE